MTRIGWRLSSLVLGSKVHYGGAQGITNEVPYPRLGGGTKPRSGRNEISISKGSSSCKGKEEHSMTERWNMRGPFDKVSSSLAWFSSQAFIPRRGQIQPLFNQVLRIRSGLCNEPRDCIKRRVPPLTPIHSRSSCPPPPAPESSRQFGEIIPAGVRE